MIDDSAGISLNIATLPVNKKKGKRKTNVDAPPKPLTTAPPKPKIVQVKQKTIQPKTPTTQNSNPPVGILKKPVAVSSGSVWKKFKQSYKKGGGVKPGFVKPKPKPDRPVGEVVENPELTIMGKKVSFQNENKKSHKPVKEFTKVPMTKVQPKFVKKKNVNSEKCDESENTSSFLNSTDDVADQPELKPDKRPKIIKFTDDEGEPKLKKYSEPDQSKLERNKGKTTSLFHNNPEIPSIPHRAVKPMKEAVFSNLCFEDMDLHPYMVKYLKESMGLTKMTTVQEKSIPALLKNQDALIRSQTGSGKTLAFVLPILHRLQEIRPKINRSDGVLVLIIVPTRELALQTYEVFNKLVKSYTWIVPGYLVGGEKKKSEKARLRKGISVLIGTPGRLIDHVQHTKALKLDKVSCLVIDEADRLLDMGYEKDVSVLLETLNQDESQLLKPSYLDPEEEEVEKVEKPKNRQTVLLSATLTQKVEKLAGLSLKNPIFIDACGEDTSPANHVPVFSNDVGMEVDTMVLPESLTQTYVVTPPKLKLVTLVSFILWKSKVTDQKKMLIFVATQDMVDFYTQLLSSALSTSNEDDDSEGEDSSHFSNSGIELFKLHGNMKQNERTEVFKTFRKSHLGVLLCTDVASRGLDLPEVDWVIQYTGPTSVSDYVHRVGRTARGGQSGSSIIFLTPNEVGFIGKLENCQIRLREEKMDRCLDHLLTVNPGGSSVQEEATNLQATFEGFVAREPGLYDLACKAFASWSRFYSSYPRNMRDSFNVKSVHQGHHAKSFALRDTPSAVVSYARKKNLNQERSPRKRPRERNESEKAKGFRGKSRLVEMSEFDSGLEPLPKKKKK